MDITDILDGIPKEGGMLGEENATPPESSPEPNETETPPSAQGETPVENNTEPEENLPFHKHPRWIARQREIETMREENENLRKSIDDLKPLKEEIEQLKGSKNSPTEFQSQSIPQWFVTLYGDNPEAWNLYQQNEMKHLAEQEQRLTQKVLSQIAEQEKRKQEEQEKYSKIFEQQFNEIGKEHNIDLSYQEGKNSVRNEFTDFITKNPIYDQNGIINLKLGWQFYKDSKQPVEAVDKTKLNARKQIAAQTVADTKGESTKKDYVTPNDIRRAGWRNYLRP